MCRQKKTWSKSITRFPTLKALALPYLSKTSNDGAPRRTLIQSLIRTFASARHHIHSET